MRTARKVASLDKFLLTCGNVASVELPAHALRLKDIE